MDDLIMTIGVAFVFVALGIAALAIGWILTGRSKIRGSCGGKRPVKGDGESCEDQETCGLCGKGEKKE